MSKKILFIAAHRPKRSPSQRFRFEQYLQALKQDGFDCKQSYLLNEKDDRLFYSDSGYLNKFWILIKCVLIRVFDVFKSFNYDIVFVQREAIFFGTSIFERLMRFSGAKLVFDFDDAIWNLDISDSNKRFSFLKNPKKTSYIIKMSDLIFAGNFFLKEYAKKYNDNVVIIPTTIDTNEYQLKKSQNKDRVCIGWSGSQTTVVHFNLAIPLLKRIQRKFGDKVYFKTIGIKDCEEEGLEIESVKWSLESEVKELSEIDIGIMPLPDDPWAKGKCGLKGLQYMALGIPTIMSPVGVNSEIIQDSKNGFLAIEEDEWFEKISLLIEDLNLRLSIGMESRKTVVEKYSIQANEDLYVSLLNSLIS